MRFLCFTIPPFLSKTALKQRKKTDEVYKQKQFPLVSPHSSTECKYSFFLGIPHQASLIDDEDVEELTKRERALKYQHIFTGGY